MASFPKNAFREYDIRGVAERDLTDSIATAVGRGFGTAMVQRLAESGEAGRAPRIVVARDCRLSSPRLHATLLEGLVATGCEVLDVGVGPTPLMYFGVHHLEADGGVMVTGSHNPADENGFKMMKGKAPFFGEDIRILRDRILASDYVVGEGTVTAHNIEEAYLAALTKGIARLDNANIVLDAGNGAGGPLGLRALGLAGAKVTPLFCDLDGRFPNHHPDPTQPENLAALIEKVKETGALVGLAYDGDADRLGAVDRTGTIIWGDKLLVLFARAILEKNPGAAVLGEVKCSQTTYDDIAKHGGRPILWKTGHSLIKTKMKEEHALLAGEMSGHLFFADRWFGFDDALYAGLRLVEILTLAGKTIGELLADLPETSITPELRLDCPDEEKGALVDAVLSHYRASPHEVIDIDGARILFGEGAWGLVRASNTQPVLVMRFEATTDARRDEIRAEVEGVLAAARARLFPAS
jgi:phosphomannomutase / phosphoglucomutase